MKKRTTIADLLRGGKESPLVGQTLTVMGWVRSFRNNQFIALNDGSVFGNLQVVIDANNTDENLVKRITNGAAISVEGQLVASQGKGQAVELVATNLEIFGDCDGGEYPLQLKNRPSLEYLRTIAHLRFRTNTFGAVFRVRHALAFAIHKFFNDNGFYYMHSPIITASDAEGAGEMFKVTTLDFDDMPIKNSIIDDLANKYWLHIKDLFEKENIDLKKLDQEISSILKEYTFERFVKAPTNTLRKLLKDNRTELDEVSKKLKTFTEGKEVATIKNMPKFLVEFQSEIFKRRTSSKLKSIFVDAPTVLKYSFHNIKLINEYILHKNEDNVINFEEDFFGRAANLTVSGQLEAELAAMALSKVYTFGPTFRAENSNTTRHLAEFWMMEPEVAFADLDDNMDLAENMLKYVIRYALAHCREDLDFLAQRLADEEKQKPQNERSEMGLIEKLEFVLTNDFERLTYTEAIEILKKSKPNQKKQFKYLIENWGADLQSEHERYLVEKHFKKPVILTNYPKDIKAFYMRQNEDNKTVAAMDILFPGIGEIIGGSQREERLDKLTQRMEEMHIPTKEMYWYLDTRRFGSCPHAGFGLGFERLILFVTGMTNIRDVIPFPRFPKSAEF